MAYGVTGVFDKGLEPKTPTLKENELLFAVREPFRSITTQSSITAGVLNQNFNLVIESLMPSCGIIFSDGIEKDYLNFSSGAIATIGLAEEKAELVVNV